MLPLSMAWIQPGGLPCKHYKLQLQIHLLARTQKTDYLLFKQGFSLVFRFCFIKFIEHLPFPSIQTFTWTCKQILFHVFTFILKLIWKWITDTSLSTTIFNKEKFFIFNFRRAERKYHTAENEEYRVREK